MAQALRFTYVPGSPRPDATKNSPRAIMLWERGKKEHEEYEFRKKLEQERYANREPNSISEFEQVERDKAAGRLRQAAIEQEEDRQNAQRAREEQERMRQQASRKDECFRLYWLATDPNERGTWVYEYAKAVGILRDMDCGFHSQSEVTATMQSLKSITNCPPSFVSRYKAIRGITMPAPPELTPAQRLANARTQLLGL